MLTYDRCLQKLLQCLRLIDILGRQYIFLQCVPGESGLTQKICSYYFKNPQFLPNHYET